MTLLATVLGGPLLPLPAATAADETADIRVSISSVSPSVLAPDAKVTLTGTLVNRNKHAWQAAQVYLVIAKSPFTTRAQVDEATDNPQAYAGDRVTDIGTFDELGDLAPGQQRSFTVSVPFDKLGITGDEGIYPVGVQVLATNTDGTRSLDSLARATTFLPLVSRDSEAVPTSVVWPFLMTDYRGVDGRYQDPTALMASVSKGGQLRNLLDLADSSGSAGTAMIDPALLVGIDDLAKRRHMPKGTKFTAAQQEEAERFLADLLVFARGHSPWILGFDRPDDLALSLNPDLRRPLRTAVLAATDAVLTKFQLSGRRVSWPTRDGVTKALISDLRDTGDSPVIVSPQAVTNWEPRLGSLIQYNSATGPVPVLVNSLQSFKGEGPGTVVTLRQKVLADAALAVLERSIDPESRADAVMMVDPQWNPGSDWASGQLSTAFNAPFVRGVGLDSLLTRPLAAYDGEVPSAANARPISRKQLSLAAEIVTAGGVLSSAISQSGDVDAELAQNVAGVLGVHWRSDRATGEAVAAARLRQTRAELDKISIESPQSVTLSSSKGGFPLTILNESDSEITVGVDLESSNPALTIPAVKPVTIGAGERHTLTVTVDLGNQRTAYLTASLVTSNGNEIGMPATFKVRSSSIGVVLWVAMGLAGALVLAALVRRFHRRRTGLSGAQLTDDDD